MGDRRGPDGDPAFLCVGGISTITSKFILVWCLAVVLEPFPTLNSSCSLMFVGCGEENTFLDDFGSGSRVRTSRTALQLCRAVII